MNPPTLPDQLPNTPSTRAKRPFGQWVSRQFNFVYVLASCLFLVLWPFSVNQWGISARAIWLVAAMLGDLILVQGCKHIFFVPRPNKPDRFAWGRRPHSGFPSGHSVPAFLLATLIWRAHPMLWLWFLGAALIAWARWQQRAHFGYQVCLSALLGVLLGLFASRWL